jgi:hypothetical protein
LLLKTRRPRTFPSIRAFTPIQSRCGLIPNNRHSVPSYLNPIHDYFESNRGIFGFARGGVHGLLKFSIRSAFARAHHFGPLSLNLSHLNEIHARHESGRNHLRFPHFGRS